MVQEGMRHGTNFPQPPFTLPRLALLKISFTLSPRDI